MTEKNLVKQNIDIKQWLDEAKSEADALGCGMYLIHNGVVRSSSKKEAREGQPSASVTAMNLSYDKEKTDAALCAALAMQGIKCIKLWINEGRLLPGDDIMYLLVGGDIRPNVLSCLEMLLSELKNNCLTEEEIL